MFEIKVTVELPGIPEALKDLADAVRGPKPMTTAAPAVVQEATMPAEQATSATEPDSAPEPQPQPQTTAPAAESKTYTFSQISKAGAALCADLTKMNQLVSLLNSKYGVPAITMIDKSRYAELAGDLIALGAAIPEE